MPSRNKFILHNNGAGDLLATKIFQSSVLLLHYLYYNLVHIVISYSYYTFYIIGNFTFIIKRVLYNFIYVITLLINLLSYFMSYSKFTHILGILCYKQIYIHTIIPRLAYFLWQPKNRVR